jgi:hypothetical protein
MHCLALAFVVVGGVWRYLMRASVYFSIQWMYIDLSLFMRATEQVFSSMLTTLRCSLAILSTFISANVIYHIRGYGRVQWRETWSYVTFQECSPSELKELCTHSTSSRLYLFKKKLKELFMRYSRWGNRWCSIKLYLFKSSEFQRVRSCDVVSKIWGCSIDLLRGI